VTFGVVHVVGSNDDQAPWFGDRTDAAGHPAPETPAERALRMREYTGREAAALEWVDAIFDSAERRHATGVVLGMQADMYDPSTAPAGLSAHEFHVDRPADQPANLTRVVVEGSTTTSHEWLRLHVDPASPQVFSCENVEFVTRRATPCPAPLAP
jgi:hypothetical protein